MPWPLRVQIERSPMSLITRQAVDAFDQIADEAKAARLRAVAVDGQRFAAQGLAHEIGDDPAVVEGGMRGP